MTTSQFDIDHFAHRIELFHSLEKSEIDLILATARPRRFSANSVMSRQGEPADSLLLLWKGRARYFFDTPNGRKLILIWITPGTVFGGAALVYRPSSYLVSTEAVRDCVVLTWDAATIQTLARRFPRLLENALFLAADYIAWYVSAHAALASQTAQERLAQVLAELAPAIGEKVADGVELDVTNEELANSANITVYTASRMISEWQRCGAIRKHRGKLLLVSSEKLFVGISTSIPVLEEQTRF